jgi:glycosyltransferase involved in cell wall biosynthesis
VIAGTRGCESLTALACGTALLAADVEANREVTPEGRGALWYRDGDFRDLVQRAAFLAGNPGFQRSLGRSGRSYIEQTRSFDATGELYDLPYRHAFRKRGSSKPTDGISGMIPLEAAG